MLKLCVSCCYRSCSCLICVQQRKLFIVLSIRTGILSSPISRRRGRRRYTSRTYRQSRHQSVGPFKYKPQKKKQALRYTNIVIVTPANDTAIRVNTGNITVNVSLEPGLNHDRGDQIALYMDGNKVSEGSATQFNLDNIDRGTHTLKASVIDASGKAVISSTPVSFTLLRQHL